ncbi:bifunctional organomercurial lyase/mercury(II) reductase MerBA [Bradyrhizobium sp. ISRA443]|uniref:bifunctional organomercurial lyase/mercury(II) reductase MerBA n=1 Tax=unclassified Bradyrhizobium TaxID=2631580 RepID=UPI002478515B|nr:MULTISPECIES: bifunctional organomercurial lyase/mercury(II) reductase MerBA [unclassified Bradyrhizobium]WGR95186.1 bifunctional organomercurial lyase/mercury(II) reductase MerBA [Bradyrhizobium sp. ISRA435]WGS00105.1 bifunctional organomercurial lyase/mercury(II) reductase MerBA [Bradyrhizobium sp. ISRA436]WGS06994.1 bifunctional organomercurial lyase/mercury(II) reductase MerBA [Bradyrhizobium sp. ISRA437]WGS13876.1 bifunctional organomercurial lyase/mercury(II) reductase MerBA [Bradyrhiz
MNDCCTSSASPFPARPSFAVRPGVTFPDWSVVTSPTVQNALSAMTGSNHVFNRWSGYDPVADRVRVALLQLYAEDGRAPTIAALAERAGSSERAILPVLEELRRRDLLVLDGERIMGAYPFTEHDTGHRVMLGRTAVNAMCAVDALGIGAMTRRDVAITSRCRHCGAPIRIVTRDRGTTLANVEPMTAVMWQSIRYEGACAANSLCATTVFFCSDEHLSVWRHQRSSDEPGFRLSIQEGLEAGRALFGPSLAGLIAAERSGDGRAHGSGLMPLDAASGPSVDRHARANGRNGNAYDLVVIGAGSAGFSAAITAADQGSQVALIGSGTIGGTCVNIGCLPSKTLIRAAETLHNARVAARFAGISAEAELTDWRATVRQKDDLVSQMRQRKYINILPAHNGIVYREGAARLTEVGVEVDGTTIRADKIIIATGARPTVPAIPGIETIPYLTSTTALDLAELPRSLLVIGGGYVGAELAQIFARAGVKVTLVCRSRLLPEAEPEIGAALTEYFGDEGIAVISGVSYRAIQRTGTGVALTIVRDGETTRIDADQVLIATGRTPNVEGLGLIERGIALSQKGGIAVDDRMRTTKAGIYAAGDVTGRDQFVYMAAYGAKLAARNALNGDSLRYDNSAMPAIVFCDPQVASVGLTEIAARTAGHAVRVSTISLDQVPRALAARNTRGLIKLVADSSSGRLLGAHILAPEGADSIQTAALAIRQGLTVDDLAETIFPYLTTVEGLKLAALSFGKDVAKLSCCAG